MNCPRCDQDVEDQLIGTGNLWDLLLVDLNCPNCGAPVKLEFEEDFDGPIGFWLELRPETPKPDA